MMKKIVLYLTASLFALSSCTNDDKYSWDEDFADLTASDTITVNISYNGSSVSVSGDTQGFVSCDGASVTVKSATNKFLQLVLSGTTSNGSLLVYSWKKFGIVLNGISLTNPIGPAINNQCGKSLIVKLADGTVNTLSDGTAYGVAPLSLTGDTIDQKGTLFSEGQIFIQGSGALTINGNAKNGIASDDYVVMESGTVNVNVASTGSNGIKVKDGFSISGGTLSIDVKADGARGIRSSSFTRINGGSTTINTFGDCLIETFDGVNDTTSCAGIKSDSLFTMTAGLLTITSSGDGGKGLNSDQNIEQSGGTLTVTTTGSNNYGKPKAVKSETGIILSGGSFKAKTNKSWACDNGVDTENPQERVTIIGTPSQASFYKREVIVVF